MIKKKYPTILTIAGSDPIGGAGIQADIKTATANGVYAMSVITAVTAQNTLGVRCYESVSPALLKDQLGAVIEDVRPDAVKIGMIPSVEAVRIIADFIIRNEVSNVILDPVCIATSGDSLAEDSVPGALCKYLFPLASLITPNIPEAELILGHCIGVNNINNSLKELELLTGVKGILLKGGHLSDLDVSLDYLLFDGGYNILESPRITTVNTHGTGCSLSSAIASFVAKGFDIPAAVKLSKQWITHAIRSGAEYEFGHGHGPINYFFNIIVQ